MTANAARAVKATRELVNAVPFLGGSDSEDDYREALELVEYLIEEDDTNPLIDFLASRIAEYENNNEKFAEFDKARCGNHHADKSRAGTEITGHAPAGNKEKQ